MTSVGVVTQVRTTSTRLPGKVLLEAAGRTMLDHHLDRLTSASLPVHVATTGNATDDVVAEAAARRGIPVHRGSEDDVLARFHGCAVEHRLDVVVRVTSDCPLVDGAVIAAALDSYLAAGDARAYLSNVVRRTYPRGFDFEIFSAELLAEAFERATAPGDREHVTPYLRAQPADRVRQVHWTRREDRSAYRVTLDTEDDLRLIRRLVEDHRAHELDCDGIVAVLDAHPELVALNAHVEQRR